MVFQTKAFDGPITYLPKRVARPEGCGNDDGVGHEAFCELVGHVVGFVFATYVVAVGLCLPCSMLTILDDG